MQITQQTLRLAALQLRHLAKRALCQAGWQSFHVPVDADFEREIEPYLALLGLDGPRKKGDATMLVLTREPEERIALKLPDGQYIWVTLIEIRRGKARIGIKAPREVQIMREEIMPAGEAVSPGHNGSP